LTPDDPSPGRFYRFVQFEYPWPLGPDDGRYLLRDHAGEEAHHVLVFEAWPTKVARSGRRWGREPEPQSVPAETGLSRATLVETTVVSEAEAQAWLEGVVADEADATLHEGLAVLNGAIRSYRAASADPVLREVRARQALTVRVGYGAGVEVAEGAWTAARNLPLAEERRRGRRRSRDSALRTQERFAALLGGRDAVLACEELALRARLDLEQRRPREAALQTHLALEAALAELVAFRAQEPVARRLDDLAGHRDAMARAANEALARGPDAETVAAVEAALAGIEATLRARSASAQY
jgi:hypothetical protein